MLQKRWLIALLAFLIALATVLLILRQYSIEEKLYRTAFVYQINLSLFSNTSTFSPHSIIAALGRSDSWSLVGWYRQASAKSAALSVYDEGGLDSLEGRSVVISDIMLALGSSKGGTPQTLDIVITFGTTLTQICKCFFMSI
jgi:hypothetical protein